MEEEHQVVNPNQQIFIDKSHKFDLCWEQQRLYRTKE